MILEISEIETKLISQKIEPLIQILKNAYSVKFLRRIENMRKK
jgi:hypothetical protein